jgi:hypothetical protein
MQSVDVAACGCFCLHLVSNQAPVTFDAKAPAGAFSDSAIAGEWCFSVLLFITKCVCMAKK